MPTAELQTDITIEQHVPDELERSDPCDNDNVRIAEYYRETMEDYRVWSRAGYMHVGFWRPWTNPFNRQQMLEATNDEVFASLRLSGLIAGQVADLGCGSGAVSSYGLDHFPKLGWTAYSICPEQIAAARLRFSRAKIRFELADFHRLPLESSSLDAAFFIESFCYSPAPELALGEAARVLKPGGRLVIVDGMFRKPRWRTPKWALRIADSAARGWALKQFHSAPEIERHAILQGFEIESIREIGWSVLPSLAYSPPLVAWHTLRLLLTGKLKGWRREHLRACSMFVLFGVFRRQFGYYRFSMVKK